MSAFNFYETAETMLKVSQEEDPYDGVDVSEYNNEDREVVALCVANYRAVNYEKEVNEYRASKTAEYWEYVARDALLDQENINNERAEEASYWNEWNAQDAVFYTKREEDANRAKEIATREHDILREDLRQYGDCAYNDFMEQIVIS